MSLAEAPATSRPLTAEDLASMPDDGIERDLIRGELREKPMTRRNPRHSVAETLISLHLWMWVRAQPDPKGQVVGGEAGFRIHLEPETYVGIDVAYVSDEVAISLDLEEKFFDGPPILAVEILSPSDEHGDVVEKIDAYLEVGTVVWIADTHFRTITVYRPGEAPVMFNDRQELDGDPYLPGFRVPVIKLFKR
jgi:Uma2 family endonuclease